GPALSQCDGGGLAAQGWFATVLAHRKEAPVAYTGQALKRFEDPRLLTGQGVFLDDLTFPDMLYAAVLRSPHAHASIRPIEPAPPPGPRGRPGPATHLGWSPSSRPMTWRGWSSPCRPGGRPKRRSCARPSTHSSHAARCVTPDSLWPLWWLRSAPWSTMPWP